jgi:hypothetical protein
VKASPFSWCRVSPWLLLVALAPCASASAQPASMAGYVVADRPTQTKQPAPPGWVGQKTIDRERRVSNTDATRGTEATYTLTFGGFTRSCPMADGVVDGNFEYALTSEVRTVPGGALQSRHSRHLVAQLRGEVGPDARLIRIELTGSWTIETREAGMPPSMQTVPVRQPVRPSAGNPDWPAMESAIRQTGDLSVATVILWAGEFYAAAELNWIKENECVEFAFDPPSDQRSLAPNESAQVRVELRTKAGGLPVPWETPEVRAIDGVGTVSPRPARAPAGTATLTYTASSQPRRGHGIQLFTTSRAGVAGGEKGKWRIAERDIRLSIDSRIWDDPGTPAALVGEALFDGTVRFDVTLKPSALPGQFRGAARVVRAMRVSHMTGKCVGSATQSEEWDLIATIDVPTKSIRLSAAMYPSDGAGTWCGEELDVSMQSEPQPLAIQAVIATPQNFRIARDDGRHETLMVTVLASPLGQPGSK